MKQYQNERGQQGRGNQQEPLKQGQNQKVSNPGQGRTGSKGSGFNENRNPKQGSQRQTDINKETELNAP